MKLAIVTVTYNSGDVINEFMDSLLSQDFTDYTLYVIDNNSTDDTLLKLKQYRDIRIEVLAQNTNLGFAKGTNIGIKKALRIGCPYICLLNNDTILTKDLFTNLLNDIDVFCADVVSPKIMFAEPDSKIPWWDSKGMNTRLKKRLELNKDMECVSSVKKIPFCCTLFRVNSFHRVGLLDERFFVYWEDTDWCFQARKLHLKMFYTPNALIYHYGSRLTKNHSDFYIKNMTMGRFWYLKKNYGIFVRIWKYFGYVYTLLLLVPERSFKVNLKYFYYFIYGLFNCG